jgi:fimbrial chaperone protein
MFLRSLTRSLIAGTALSLAATFAHAMSVTPIQIEMATVGSTRPQFSVTNDAKEPLPVEIQLQALKLDENGGRKLEKAKDNFLVFPPQALIPPGATQVFRLQWVGDPAIAQSESYMLSVNQIPVKMPAGKSAVQIVMSFGVVVNVAPPQGLPDLKLVGSGVTTDKSGKRFPTITVENKSKIHALLPQSTINLKSGAWTRSMAASEISEKVGIGLVQPGAKRKFTLPIELPANVQQVQATMDFKPKR